MIITYFAQFREKISSDFSLDLAITSTQEKFLRNLVALSNLLPNLHKR